MANQIKTISEDEMYRVFNMGIGMTIVCSKENLEMVKKILNENGEEFAEIGYLEKSDQGEACVEYI